MLLVLLIALFLLLILRVKFSVLCEISYVTCAYYFTIVGMGVQGEFAGILPVFN
jgi:hypothetical protein